jgi:hypothetical protein
MLHAPQKKIYSEIINIHNQKIPLLGGVRGGSKDEQNTN